VDGWCLFTRALVTAKVIIVGYVLIQDIVAATMCLALMNRFPCVCRLPATC